MRFRSRSRDRSLPAHGPNDIVALKFSTHPQFKKEKIEQFFEGFQVVPNSIKALNLYPTEQFPKRRGTVQYLVLFESEKATDAALDAKNMQSIDKRIVYLEKTTYAEYQAAKSIWLKPKSRENINSTVEQPARPEENPEDCT